MLLKEVFRLKQNFQKNKVVTGKTPFILIGQFCSQRFIWLNIFFWYSNNAFSTSSFFEKDFRFPENLCSSIENV